MMYTAINGIYENGKFTLSETPPTNKKSKVIVMFIEEIGNQNSTKKGIRLGGLANMGYNVPEDFNDPIDDLNDYM